MVEEQRGSARSEILDNARDYTDAAFVKNVLNGGQKGLNGAFCSPHYVLEGH